MKSKLSGDRKLVGSGELVLIIDSIKHSNQKGADLLSVKTFCLGRLIICLKC